MRRELSTIEAMQLVNISCKGDEIPEVKMGEMLNSMIFDYENNEGEQLNYMKARIYGGRTLQSYDTIVAYYDGVNVIELGRYSSSTARQVTAFANMYGADVIRLKDAYEYIKTLNDKSYKFIW